MKQGSNSRKSSLTYLGHNKPKQILLLKSDFKIANLTIGPSDGFFIMCDKLPDIMEYLGTYKKDADQAFPLIRTMLLRRVAEDLKVVVLTDVFR